MQPAIRMHLIRYRYRSNKTLIGFIQHLFLRSCRFLVKDLVPVRHLPVLENRMASKQMLFPSINEKMA